MKPRVVHVITRLIAGGAQLNTILACQALAERYDVTLVTGPAGEREGSLFELARERAVATRVVPELIRPVRPARDLAALRALERLFGELQPHIVHTHSSKAGILGRAAAWRAGVPIIVHTNHGLPFHRFQPWPARAVYWALERLATSVCRRIVCVGEEMKRQSIAARLGPAELFEVVYSGFEAERFATARSVRERLGIPAGVAVAGVVSRMAQHKGQRFLVEAAPPGVHLLFVGDGECRDELRRAVSSRSIPATFTGHVPVDDVPDLLASMDVLVHPSLWEGLPRAIVEAMFVGRPVVAFDCDGAREVVTDGVTGHLVAPRDVAGLRAAIAEILARPDRGRALGEEGRRRLGDRFDRRTAAARLDAVYRSLLDGERG